MVPRRIEPILAEDLPKKMVFLAGPRQCGKTTLALALCEARHGRYYSWDIAADRRRLNAGELDAAVSLWAFDELHKNRRWRNWLKGIFDEHGKRREILVTGSARLELYGRGGDSLQGRYFMHRLHPLTLSEVSRREAPAGWLTDFSPADAETTEALAALLRFGGFPEPFARQSDREAGRWRLAYGARLVREEVRDLERVVDLDRMELMFDRLADCVGSPLSLNSLREDLDIAHGTARKWLSIFERLYGVFRVPPFGPPRIKAVKKEAKVYPWDWARVSDPAARLENLVAVHLQRYAHWLEDVDGRRAELRYFRTPMGHEVDFVLLIDRRPILAVEVKTAHQPIDRGLRYLLERTEVPRAFQISLTGQQDVVAPPIRRAKVRLMPAATFLAALP